MPDKAELFQKGYNCCQIIAVYLAPVCGFDAEEIKDSFNIMCDTCGGTCSTLCGGTFCLTAWAKQQGYDHDQTRALVDRLYDAFKEKHGGILCKEIAKNDLMVCAGFVDTVVELTKQLIAEEKTACSKRRYRLISPHNCKNFTKTEKPYFLSPGVGCERLSTLCILATIGTKIAALCPDLPR